MGIASYSVYLLHGIALYVARPWLTDHLQNAPVYWGQVTLLAAGVAVISLITYWGIELPFINFEKRLRRRSSRHSERIETSETVLHPPVPIAASSTELP